MSALVVVTGAIGRCKLVVGGLSVGGIMSPTVLRSTWHRRTVEVALKM